jgi:alpha/beta superfamily hydrolase
MDDTVIFPQDADRLSYAIGSNSEVVQITGEGHFYQKSMNLVRIRIKDFLREIL